jgi:hypothetical protein
MSAVLKTHLDRDCMDAKDLQDAFVTSCQLESFFAVIDDVNRVSNFISISQNRGQAMAIKSHTFMTAEERLRQEIHRRKKSKLPAMTKDEVCLFFIKLLETAIQSNLISYNKRAPGNCFLRRRAPSRVVYA